VIEGTLNSLEVLCKTRADSDSLREAKNILLNVKGMMEGLKVTGTNIDHKADALRSMLASLPATQPHSLLQPFMQAQFPNPWHPQFTPQPSLGGTQGIQNAPPQLTQNPPSGAPTPSLEPPVLPVPPAVPAVLPPKPTSTQDPPAQASAASKKQDDSLSVAIPASVDASGRLLNKDGLPKTVDGMKAVLRGLGFPDVALKGPDKYFVVKPKQGDTIRTVKATFPDNPYKRAGFPRVANSEHVAHKLADAGIEIGDWKSQEAMQVEQSNRFARDAAEETKKALDESMTALFNGTVFSALKGLEATSRHFGF
jgi:hypothetical protein